MSKFSASFLSRLFRPARSTRRCKVRSASTTPAEVDVLESRELLSATMAQGVITIQGQTGGWTGISNGAYVQVYNDPSNASMIVVYEGGTNGKSTMFPAAKVNQIVFNGTNDADYFDNRTRVNTVANGNAGNDLMNAGYGNNTINGGRGNDKIYMYNGGGTVNCGDGDDTVYSGEKSVQVRGGNGDDIIWGSSKNDILFGDAGNDLIYGQDGNDFIDGGDGNDALYDGRGSDTILGGNGLDKILIMTDDGQEDYVSQSGQSSVKSESWWRTFFQKNRLIFNGWINER